MFTSGIEQVLHVLRPGNRPSGRTAFPPGLPDGGARRSADEPAHAWLRRCIDGYFAGDIGRVRVEENLALFLVVHWSGGHIQYTNLQALWAQVPLSVFIDGGDAAPHRYLRLDYDMTALGPLLKEPQPHVHVEPDGEPRFPLSVSAADDVVGWFLDFIYRNFFYEDWILWAEVVWDDRCRMQKRDNRWPRLVEVFNQSAIGVLEQDADLRRDLRDLKRCLLDERRLLFPLMTKAARIHLLSHEGLTVD